MIDVCSPTSLTAARSCGVPLLLFAVLSLFLQVSKVSAEPTPEIQANQVADNAVGVTVRAVSRPKKYSSVVVKRALGNSSKFVKVAQFKIKGTVTIKFVDSGVSGSEMVTYRTRLIGRKASRWSKNARVVMHVNDEVQDPEDLVPLEPTPEPPPISIPVPPPVAPPVVVLPPGSANCPRAEVVKVFTLVAQARAAVGLPPLQENLYLAASSQKFSANMAATSNFSHSGWYENILASGYVGTSAGQNIGYSSQLSGDQIFTAWMGSPGHKVNILSPGFSDLGVGCVADGKGLFWWTQDFGG